MAMEALLDGEAEALTRKAIEMALDGDGPAMRLCLDRLCPPPAATATCRSPCRRSRARPMP
jgi:hypothetical protein